MGGGGSIQGMNNSLKGNRQLLRKKSYFKKERSFLNRKREYEKASEGIVDVRKASKEQLKEIRARIIKKRRRENLILICITVIVVVPAAYFSYNFLNNSNDQNSRSEKVITANENKYNFFISDGDSYLKKGKWHNAVFQYNKALEIAPNDYHAQYRIGYAYVYWCRNENLHCEQAEESLTNLIKNFPNRSELIELEQVLIFALNN